jgi:Xaa-Pro aminopeptidase
VDAAVVSIPFDAKLLDELMESARVDAVIATSKHNVQYLLGGYRFFFFSAMDAIGLSRYLPAVVYLRGRPADSFYVGNPMEGWQQEHEPLWVGEVVNEAKSSSMAAELAAARLDSLGLSAGRIAVELPFLPADAFMTLQRRLPGATYVDAVVLLEELRAVKHPDELALLEAASDAIVDSMLATIDGARAGITTEALAERLRAEETARKLVFDYCLVATGGSINRSPSAQRWERGFALSLDSGGTKNGYIGDLARMAVLGAPSALMQELLEEVDSVQQAARGAVRAGALGADVYEQAAAALAPLPHREHVEFEAHGVGLVTHEVPHLTGTGNWPYPGTHADRPLRAGMVLSIETTMRHPVVGFVKLEDTVVVTDSGARALGDFGRGWNVVDP